MTLLIRDAAASDIGAVQRIYAHHVLHGFATFEETPPTADELLKRRESVFMQRALGPGGSAPPN